MRPYLPKRCPLCGGPADINPFAECKAYRCANCREFAVTASAADLLPQESAERRAHWSSVTRRCDLASLLVIDRTSITPPRLDASIKPRREALNLLPVAHEPSPIRPR